MSQFFRTQLEKDHWRLGAVGTTLTVLFIILDLIVFSGRLQSTGTALFYSINLAHTPLLDYAMILLTNYGREVVWGCFIILLWFFGGREGKLTAFILLITFLSLAIPGESLKLLEFRPRPFEILHNVRLLIPPSTDSSFPSGHALIVSAGAAIACRE